MLFINQKDLDDLRDEIYEEYRLQPSKSNTKDNKEKKLQRIESLINVKKQKNNVLLQQINFPIMEQLKKVQNVKKEKII